MIDKTNAACLNKLRDSYERMVTALQTIPSIQRMEDYVKMKKMTQPLPLNDERHRRWTRSMKRRVRGAEEHSLLGHGNLYDNWKKRKVGV